MVDLLVAARGVHFASTASVVGVALVQCLIAEPALRTAGADLASVQAYQEKLRTILLIGLALAILSGAVWPIVLAASIASEGPTAAVSSGAVSLLLTSTQFGHVWLVRLGLVALLLGLFSIERHVLSAILAAAFMGTLAWSGHGGATPGVEGSIHLVADILHLVAAGAWLGGLLPLWLLFRLAIRQTDPSLVSAVQVATHRFSTLGVLAVGTLLVTGLVNTWALVGTLRALVETDYGRLLLLKIVLFVAMVAIAAANRLRLAPRLPEGESLRRLARNVLVEVGLGLAIIAAVSVLGVLAPAAHMGMQMH